MRVLRILADKSVVLESEVDGRLLKTNLDDLLKKYEERKLRFISNEQPHEDRLKAQKLRRPLSTYSEKIQNKAIRKKQYLDFILQFGTFTSAPYVLRELIYDCAQNIGDQSPPSAITVYRWHRKLCKAKGDHRSLIDRFDLRGSMGSRLSPEVLELLRDAIESIYLNVQRNSGSAVHSELIHRINQANEFRPEGEKLKAPSKVTVHRTLAGLDKYEVISSRYGKHIADMKFRTSLRGPRPERILERVEIDHTPLDLFVIDEETGLPMGRPTATVAIDVYSKMPVGLHIGFEGPSIESVFACLRNAIAPKTYIQERYPEIEGDWPCYGRIEVLVCDNGLEFHSYELERVALELGMQLEFCPKRQGNYKGSIERYLKTLNFQFAHALPGTSFARWFHREDYDSLKHAILTYEQLLKYFHRWLIDVYAKSIHRGISAIPYHTWNDAVRKHPPILISDLARLDIALGRTRVRVLSHAGIEINNLRYNDPVLLVVRRQHGERVKVEVRYYFGDVSYIHVIDPVTKEPIPVPAVDSEYANRLTLEQHRLICARVREVNAGLINISSLVRAKAEIREIIQELAFSKSQRTRQRAAKIRGISGLQKDFIAKESEIRTTISKQSLPPTLSKHVSTNDLPKFGSISLSSKKGELK